MSGRPAADRLPLPKDAGLTLPAATIEEEQAIERAAELAPLDASAVPPEVSDVRSTGFSLREKLLSFRSLVSFALAFGLIGLIFWRADVRLADVWAQFRQVNIGLYLIGFVGFYALFPLRALRWRILLRSAGFAVDGPSGSWARIAPLSEFILLSWFANCIIPAKLGDAYRGYLVRKNGGASFSRTLGTVFAERVVDMIVLFGMLVVSGLLIFRGRVNGTIELLFIIGILLTVILIAGLMSMRYLSPLIRRVIPQRFHGFYERFEEGTLASFRPSQLPTLLGLTILIWLGEAFRLYMVVMALGGYDLSAAAVIFVALASSLLTAVPALPGGLGLVEGGIATAMQLFGVGGVASTAVALLDRTINYWSIVIIGFIVYLFSPRK